MKSKFSVSKVFSIILLLVFFSACDKGEIVSTDNLKPKLVLESDDITQAKDYFYKEIIPKKQLRDNINRYYLYFDWKKASKIKNKEDNSSYISVPIFNTKSSIDEKSFAAISAKYYKDRKLPNVSKNLIIRENNLGVKTYEIYTYIPDEKKYKDSKIKNYWGYTLISDVNENFLRGFVVKDNKISSKILKSNAQKALKVSCEGWVEVITWQEPLEGEAGIVLHTLTINHPGDCGNNNDEDQAAGNYSGDQGGPEEGTGSDECNEMATLANEAPAMVGDIESYQLNDLGDGRKEALLRIHISRHSVYDLYSNAKVVVAPNGPEHLKFEEVSAGTPFIIKKRNFVVTANVVSDYTNHDSYATLHYNGNIDVTFPFTVTCEIPPFAGSAGPFTDSHPVNNVRKDINPYMFQ